MRINSKPILGFLLVAGGSMIFESGIIKHMSRDKAVPNEIFALVIFLVGIYFLLKRKRQQLTTIR